KTAYIITTSGLSVVSLTRTDTSTRPAVPLGLRGITNSATGTQAIKPGSFVTITGQNLAGSGIADQIPLPTVMGGSCVVLNDVPLNLISVSPTEIQAQVPDDLLPGLYVFQVRSLALAQQSDSLVLTLQKP
ncbi:MAG: hypothetical protein HY821_12220, partial [Acidobacteria bacterium]|nr:hypothetical protein [Acidobacteriota bacterium]